MDKTKSKKGASVSHEFALFLTEVQLDLPYLQFAQNKDINIQQVI